MDTGQPHCGRASPRVTREEEDMTRILDIMSCCLTAGIMMVVLVKTFGIVGIIVAIPPVYLCGVLAAHLTERRKT